MNQAGARKSIVRLITKAAIVVLVIGLLTTQATSQRRKKSRSRSITKSWYQFKSPGWDKVTMEGLQGRSVSSSLQIERFFRIAERILARTPNYKGRPLGSRQYPTGSEFYKIVKSTYELLHDRRGRPPLKKEIAAELKLSSFAFRVYWRTTSRIWPPI